MLHDSTTDSGEHGANSRSRAGSVGVHRTDGSKISLAELGRQCAPIKDELEAAIGEVVGSSWFIGGPVVERFEANFAQYCGARECVSVASGTDALFLTLKALGIGAGDEVITVSHTFIATVSAIAHAGATAVFCDIDPITYCMDPSSIAEKITERTKAIIPVHLYGHPADMDPIMHLADRHRLFVLEDSAQAHGAMYKGRRTGSLGHAAAFSFYPGKNLGAFGDGGAITTSDTELAVRLRRWRDHGRIEKYAHETFGYNSRLDAIQAAVLDVKLKYLDAWNDRRRAVAGMYASLLDGVDDLVLPVASADVEPVWHLYAVRSRRRSVLQAALDEENICHGIHYPIPVHLQPAWDGLGGESMSKGAFPLIEQYSSQLLSLPVHECLTDDEVESVARVVRSVPTGDPR
jgi:dTDP-4-amino-4,6-dideoxygalactose transaminase